MRETTAPAAPARTAPPAAVAVRPRRRRVTVSSVLLHRWSWSAPW